MKFEGKLHFDIISVVQVLGMKLIVTISGVTLLLSQLSDTQATFDSPTVTCKYHELPIIFGVHVTIYLFTVIKYSINSAELLLLCVLYGKEIHWFIGFQILSTLRSFNR